MSASKFGGWVRGIKLARVGVWAGSGALALGIWSATPAMGQEAPPASADSTQVSNDPRVQSLYDEANKLLKDKKPTEAAAKLSEALKIDPNFLLGYYRQGQALAEAGRHLEAISAFSNAVALNPRMAPALYFQGVSLNKLGDYEQAVKVLTKAISNSNRARDLEVLAYKERGFSQIELGNAREALEDYNEALDRMPIDPELLEGRAKSLMRLGQIERSAGANTAGQRYTAALASLDRAVQLNDKRASLFDLRGQLKLDIGQTEEALEDFKTAVKLEIDNRDYLQRLAVAYFQHSSQMEALHPEKKDAIRAQIAQAVETLDKLIGMGPPKDTKKKPTDAYLARAAARINLTQYAQSKAQRDELAKKAIEDCDAALALDARLSIAIFNKGLAYRILEDMPKAISHYNDAMRLSQDTGEIHLRRGIARFHLGELGLALNDFQEVAQANGDPRALFWCGLVYARRNDQAEAIRNYTEALRANPAYLFAYLNRGLAQLQLGDTQRAIDDFNEVIRRNGNVAEAYYYRGLAQDAAGNTQAAIDSQQSAVLANPKLAAAQRELARLFEKTGDRAAAARHSALADEAGKEVKLDKIEELFPLPKEKAPTDPGAVKPLTPSVVAPPKSQE